MPAAPTRTTPTTPTRSPDRSPAPQPDRGLYPDTICPQQQREVVAPWVSP